MTKHIIPLVIFAVFFTSLITGNITALMTSILLLFLYEQEESKE